MKMRYFVNRRRWILGALTSAAAAGVLLLGRPVLAQKTLDFYVQPGLKDLTSTVKVISKSDKELEKIGSGYVDVYRMDKRQIMCKEPNRVRLEGKQGVFTIRYVTNGDRKLTEVPTLRIHKVDDISKEPGKGDSIFDLGVITQSWVDGTQSRWLRTETRDNKTLQVFEVWDSADPRSRRTVWFDPSNHTVVERITHHRNKNKSGFRKRLVYSEPKQVNGIWLPTRVQLFNADNKLAADVRYDSIQVNSNLADSLFSF